MPLYEYACQECGGEAELLVNNSSQPVCPKCGSKKLDKLLSVVSTPARSGVSGETSQGSGGGCGAHCGCHPHG